MNTNPLEPHDLQQNPERMKQLSRCMSRDMSPEAIDRRLQVVSQLRSLTLDLGRAVEIGPAEPNDC